jgi:hypothetical protein
MPQGFKNSPAVFQRAMNLCFNEVIGEKCLIYIDDILVFGRTVEEHDKNLLEINKIIKKYNFVENKTKRIERVEEVKFLGYNISFKKIKPNVNRAQGILNYATPKTKRGVQRFLGLINYDRMFLKYITEQTRPLYKLVEKDSKFVWDLECESAFQKIKENWNRRLELNLPDMEKEFELETDASNIGLGAVLRQENKPVAYISRSLSKSEANYSITEKEVLAAIWAMEKLQFYLVGKEFVLITDHKAMEEMKKKLEFGSSRIYRWFNRIERFQFRIRYREGKHLIAVDALSRAPDNICEEGKIICVRNI